MDREKVIKGLDEVWEYMSKNVKDIASRKVRMMDKVADACNLLKEQDGIIKHYQKADGFLLAHGWKWENYIDDLPQEGR